MKIDSEKCIGCGVCETMCPQCFKMNSGVSEIQQETCDECDLEDVVASCPVDAIILDK
jgi:ferredoxin